MHEDTHKVDNTWIDSSHKIGRNCFAAGVSVDEIPGIPATLSATLPRKSILVDTDDE